MFPAYVNVTKLVFVPLLTVDGVDVNGYVGRNEYARRAVQTKVSYREVLIHSLLVLRAQFTQPALNFELKKGLDAMMFAFLPGGVALEIRIIPFLLQWH